MEVGAGVLPFAAKLTAVGPDVTAPSTTVTFQLVGDTLSNWTVSGCLLPCESYVMIEVITGVVLVVSAGRLPPTVTFWVGLGCSSVPIGRVTSPGAALVSTTPLTAVQPCTTPP